MGLFLVIVMFALVSSGFCKNDAQLGGSACVLSQEPNVSCWGATLTLLGFKLSTCTTLTPAPPAAKKVTA